MLEGPSHKFSFGKRLGPRVVEKKFKYRTTNAYSLRGS